MTRKPIFALFVATPDSEPVNRCPLTGFSNRAPKLSTTSTVPIVMSRRIIGTRSFRPRSALPRQGADLVRIIGTAESPQ